MRRLSMENLFGKAVGEFSIDLFETASHAVRSINEEVIDALFAELHKSYIPSSV